MPMRLTSEYYKLLARALPTLKAALIMPSELKKETLKILSVSLSQL